MSVPRATAELEGRPVLQGVVRGLLPLYVLHLLSDAPAYGSEITERIAAASGRAWSPSPGSLYPTLRRLEKDGLILGRWERGPAAPRRVYALTETGRDAMGPMRRDLLADLRLVHRIVGIHLRVLSEQERVAP